MGNNFRYYRVQPAGADIPIGWTSEGCVGAEHDNGVCVFPSAYHCWRALTEWASEYRIDGDEVIEIGTDAEAFDAGDYQDEALRVYADRITVVRRFTHDEFIDLFERTAAERGIDEYDYDQIDEL